MNQRGFLAGPLLYLVLGLGAVTLLSGGWAWIQGQRLEAAQDRLQALEALYDTCLASAERQNQAVKELEEAGKAAQERARMAQAALEGSRRGVMSELERLRALKPKPSSCPAADWVAAVRQGLK